MAAKAINKKSPLPTNHHRSYSIERHKRTMRARSRKEVGSLLCFIGVCCVVATSSSLLRTAQASGVFELELIKLDSHAANHQVLRKSNQTNPIEDVVVSSPSSIEEQDDDDDELKLKRVFVCLKEAFTSHPIDGPCTFGNASLIVSQQSAANQTSPLLPLQATTGKIAEEQQQQQQGSLLTNLVRIPITFKWTKSFTIILSVEEPVGGRVVRRTAELDNQLPHGQQQQQQQQQQHLQTTITDGSNAPPPPTKAANQSLWVDRHVLTESEVIPDLEINPTKPWTIRSSRGLKSSLAYRFRLYCTANYYGDGCNTFCRPRDDQFGHYRCSPSGQKICLEGWQGQENNCLQAKCRPGCQTGQCDLPDTCKCRSGWTGPRCDQCLTYPGCQNGYCLSPGQCLCHQNWGGVLCDQDLNYCSTHEPCKNNATCQNVAPGRYKCNCPDKYTGVNCDLSLAPKVASNSQQQQQQQQVTAGCSLNPCLNGGVCLAFDTDKLIALSASSGSSRMAASGGKRFYRCQCTSGWTGDYCQWPESQLSPSIATIYESDHTTQSSSGESQSAVDAPATATTTTTTTTTLMGATDLAEVAADRAATFIESPTIIAAMPPPPMASADMRHLISGVVIASAIGVFMASLLLAWCCLAAFERNGFSFIQMNIIRSSQASNSADNDQAGQHQPVRATLRRMQEKLRNSFRRSHYSSKRQIKPETKLSIENVLRPPPSYEESRHQPDYVCFAIDDLDQPYASAHQSSKLNQDEIEVEKPMATIKSNNLVIRGAIEQKLLQTTTSSSSNKYTSKQTIISANHQEQRHAAPQQTNPAHISSQLNCPKHGHLYRKTGPLASANTTGQQTIRPLTDERDLKINRYPRNTEIVIRAEDLYEDHSALR